MPIRIIVIEPQEIVRIGLRALFASAEHNSREIVVVAEGTTPDDIVPLYTQFQPDIVLTEVQFPGTTGFEAIDSLRQGFPNAKVCVLTASDNPAFLARAAVSGMDDYLEKTAQTSELLSVLVRLYDGMVRPIGHKLDRMTLRMKSKQVFVEHDVPLTGREVQILRHIAFGMSNKEIARSLSISIDTVKEHVQNILRKMGFRDRTNAAVWAVRKKMI